MGKSNRVRVRVSVWVGAMNTAEAEKLESRFDMESGL